MIRKIIDIKNPRLRQKSKPVNKIDKQVLGIIADLRDTLTAQKDPEGVGLAAPQIGKNLKVFIINHEGQKRVIINPKIISRSAKNKPHYAKASRGQREILEGCLSLPNYYGPLNRNLSIKIEYLDEKGDKKIEEFKGFLAQIVQHEIDHLNGILFIDRILEQKTPLYKFDKGDWEEVELV